MHADVRPEKDVVRRTTTTSLTRRGRRCLPPTAGLVQSMARGRLPVYRLAEACMLAGILLLAQLALD